MRRDYTKVEGSVSVEKAGRDYELNLDGMRFQVGQRIAEELLGALSKALRPYAGYSIFGRIQEELDTIVDRLQSEDGAAEDGRDPGRAEALCRALAMIRNPYAPDFDAERDGAMERWEARNA